jgi:hypothetical protein
VVWLCASVLVLGAAAAVCRACVRCDVSIMHGFYMSVEATRFCGSSCHAAAAPQAMLTCRRSPTRVAVWLMRVARASMSLMPSLMRSLTRSKVRTSACKAQMHQVRGWGWDCYIGVAAGWMRSAGGEQEALQLLHSMQVLLQTPVLKRAPAASCKSLISTTNATRVCFD